MSGNSLFQNLYTVGKGRLFFGQFISDQNRTLVNGAGVTYFGNTPSFEAERKATVLQHMDSDAGQKVVDDSLDIETQFSGKFSVDNITGNNLALFFGGTSTNITQAAGTANVSNNYTITPDTFIMLGANPSNPTGDVAIGSPTVTVGGTTAVDPSLYNYDVNTGLLYVQPTASLDAVWNIAYPYAAAQLNQVVETGTSIYGQLLFVANNPRGPQRDYFFPFVKITSEGTMPLKGDTWMTLTFAWEAMNLNQSTKRVYVRARPASLVIPDGP